MVSLYHDPTGEKVLTSDSLFSSHPKNNTASESPEETISDLRARIKELESMISTKDASI